VLTASTADLLQRTIVAIQQEFAMKDLEPLHFLVITAERRSQGLFLHQRQYDIDILERVGMSDCKPCSTPGDTQAKLSEDDGPSVADATSYRSLTGALQYLTLLARHRLRRPASVFAYAHVAGAPYHRSQADPMLPPRLPRLRPPTLTIPDIGARGLQRR
jgi:hypothetical protein